MSTVNPPEAVVDTVTEREEPPATRRTGLGELWAEKSCAVAARGRRVTRAITASAATVDRNAIKARSSQIVMPRFGGDCRTR